jgi:hypothetical protein
MRALDIAIFIFMINMMVNLVSNVIFPELNQPSYFKSTTSTDINNTGKNASTIGFIVGTGDYKDTKQATDNLVGSKQGLDSNPITGSFTMLWTALTFFITLITQSLIILPTLIDTFHVPVAIAAIIQTFVWLAYGLGIMQFLSGRSTAGME